MDRDGTRQPRTRQLVEVKLFNDLRQCHAEWTKASHDERSAARERFMDALHRFSRLVLHNAPPETSK